MRLGIWRNILLGTLLRLPLFVIVAIALNLLIAQAQPQQTTTTTRVTYYTLTGYMASGLYTYDGAAACGYAIPMYSTITIIEAGVTVQCLDTGGGLSAYQIDVWSPGGRPYWLTQDYYTIQIG